MGEDGAGRALPADEQERGGGGSGWAEFAAERFGADLQAGDLDFERSEGAIVDQFPEPLSVEREDLLDGEGLEEWGGDRLGAGEEVDAGREPGDRVRAGEAVEEAGARQGGVGVVEVGGGGAERGRGVEGGVVIGPGGVGGQDRRAAAGFTGEKAEPEGGLLALASKADQFDLDVVAVEMGLEIAGRAELEGTSGGGFHESKDGFEIGLVVGEILGARAGAGAAVGVEVEERPGGDGGAVGVGLEGEQAVVNPGGAGVPGGAPGHIGVAVDRQDESGGAGDLPGVATEPAAQVGHEVRVLVAFRLVSGDFLRGGLLDPGRVEPEGVGVVELGMALAAGLDQSERGGDFFRGGELPPSGEVGGARVVDVGDEIEQRRGGWGAFPREESEFGVGVFRGGHQG